MSEQVPISAELQKNSYFGLWFGRGKLGSSFLHYGFNVRAWDPDTIPLETFADRIKGPMFQLQSLGEGTKP